MLGVQRGFDLVPQGGDACCRGELLGNEFEQGRFSASIGPDEGNFIPTQHVEVGVLK